MIGEIDKTLLSHELKPFKQVFNLLQAHSKQIMKQPSGFIGDESCPSEIRQKALQKLVMPVSHFQGKNIWILKPTGLNRGKGIHVVDSVKEVKRIVKQTCIEHYMVKHPQSASIKFKAKTADKKPVQESKTFVVQKYIESPFLMRNRKFDIRVWVLVNQDMDLFFFREGYIRMSSAEYSVDRLEDDYIHLTNNAIQRNCPTYGTQEDGNQLSFQDLQMYMKENCPQVDFNRDIVEKMKVQTQIAFSSVSKKLNAMRRKHCFELFGLDFMLDSDLNCWLIEANTNPCIEESSRLLKTLLPRMLDDMFKLTIDQLFSQPQSQPETKSKTLLTSVLKQRQQTIDLKTLEARPSPYPVLNYAADFNLW